jgi:hypothetical protein
MNCNDIKKKLIFLVGDDLSPVEEKQVFSHLAKCKECRMLFEKLKSAFQVIENEKIKKEDSFFVNRIMKRIEAKESEQKNKISLMAIRILRPAGISLLSAAAIFTGIILGAKFSVQLTTPEDQRYLEIDAFANEYFLDELREENIESILFTQNTE